MKKLFNTYDSFVVVIKNRDDLEKAIDIIQTKQQEILDIQSPHYINVRNLKGTKKVSNYGIIAGISGLIGLLSISFLIFNVMTNPHLLMGNMLTNQIAAYIPVLFTIMILFAGLGLVIAFGIKNHLLPGQKNKIIDKYVSDDHYILIILKKISRTELEQMISGIEISDIFECKFIKQNINLPIPLRIS
jgi:hypothetical protein